MTSRIFGKIYKTSKFCSVPDEGIKLLLWLQHFITQVTIVPFMLENHFLSLKIWLSSLNCFLKWFHLETL